MQASIINPYGYDPKRGGGGSGIEFGEIDVGRAKKEAQLFFGRKGRTSTVWTAPGGNATAFSRTVISSWSLYSSDSIQDILLEGVVRSEEITEIEVEIDGVAGILDNRTNLSAPNTLTMQGKVSENNIVLYLEVESKGKEYTALRSIRLTISSSVFKGHFELKRIILRKTTAVTVVNTDEAGLYISKDTRTSSEGADLILERMGMTQVLYLDDLKDRERLIGFVGDNRERFRIKENLAPGKRLLFFMRRDRCHLNFEVYSEKFGYTYKNKALNDEKLKSTGRGNLRYFIENPSGSRQLSKNIPLALDQNNYWTGDAEEIVAGVNVRCSVGNIVFFRLGYGERLPEDLRIGIYSLELGGHIISDDPDIYFGSAVSVGNGEFFLESTVFPNRESAEWMSKFLSQAPHFLGENFDMPVLYYDENRNLWKFNPSMGIESRMVTEYEFNELAARVTALENKG